MAVFGIVGRILMPSRASIIEWNKVGDGKYL